MGARKREVERIEAPGVDLFQRDYHLPRRPVILTGVADRWKAIEAWDAAYLKEVCGSVKLPIAISKTRLIPSNPEKGWGTQRREEMNFDRFLDMISEGPLEKTYYLQHKSIPDVFPQLMQDFEIPAYVDKPNRTFNLWIGSGGNQSPIHYDIQSNFLTQVRGRKRVLLIAPSDTKHLHLQPKLSHNLNLSPINFMKPEYEKHPLYRQAEIYECILELGEMLFIPAFWWHAVETLQLEMTISINIWWDAPVRHWLTYLGLRQAIFATTVKLK